MELDAFAHVPLLTEVNVSFNTPHTVEHIAALMHAHIQRVFINDNPVASPLSSATLEAWCLANCLGMTTLVISSEQTITFAPRRSVPTHSMAYTHTEHNLLMQVCCGLHLEQGIWRLKGRKKHASERRRGADAAGLEVGLLRGHVGVLCGALQGPLPPRIVRFDPLRGEAGHDGGDGCGAVAATEDDAIVPYDEFLADTGQEGVAAPVEEAGVAEQVPDDEGAARAQAPSTSAPGVGSLPAPCHQVDASATLAASAICRVYRGHSVRRRLRRALAAADYRDADLELLLSQEEDIDLLESLGASPVELEAGWMRYEQSGRGAVVYGDHKRRHGTDTSLHFTSIRSDAFTSTVPPAPIETPSSSSVDAVPGPSRPCSAASERSLASASSEAHSERYDALAQHQSLLPTVHATAHSISSDMAEWGITDPTLMATLLKRNKRMKGFQHAKAAREKNKDPEVRYQKFIKSANGAVAATEGGSVVSYGRKRSLK